MKRNRLLRFATLVLTIPISLSLFTSCTKKITGTEISNEDGVCLTGKVLSTNNQGVPDIIARIDGLNLADTTDINGYYSLRLNKNELNNLHINLDTLSDSVKIISSGSIVSNIKITKWIDSLPSVFLVQRNIYGSLQTADTVFEKIVAIISSLDSNKNVLQQFSKELWFNSKTKGFSGFCYFSNKNGKQNFSVYVKVYNKDSVFTGKSETVYFNQLAGDIEIPSFESNVNPDLKISAGNDTTLTINDTLRLSAKIISGTSTHINKWEWNINGNGFVQTASADTVIILPRDSSDYVCIVKATDISGNVAMSRIVVHCIKDVPRIIISVPIGVALNKTTTIQASAEDRGKIQKWEWNIGGIEYQQKDSTINPYQYSFISFKTPDSFTTIHCSVKVTDDDGNTKTDTVSINLGAWTNSTSIFNTTSLSLLAFYQNTDFCIWGVGQYDTIDSIRIYKSDFQNTSTIGTIPLSGRGRSGNLQSSCISQDGSIYVAGSNGDQSNQHILIYKYKDSLWNQIPTENLAQGDISSLSMESIGNDIYIGLTLNNRQHFLYKYNGSEITEINLGVNSALNSMVITKSKQDGIYICGDYKGTNDSSYYFLKEYSNGTLRDISSGLRINGQIISMFLYNGDILFGIAQNVSYVMHAGIFDSYLVKYSNNTIERFGGYLGRSSNSNLVLTYLKNGSIYAVDNQNLTFKLE